VESLKSGFSVVAQTETPGQLRLITVSTGTGNEVTGTTPLLTLHFKAKAALQTVTGSITLTNVIVSDAFGIETTVSNGAAYNVQIIFVDKAALQALLTSTQNVHDTAVEGVGIGKYPLGSKAILQAAIDSARAVAQDSAATQLQVDQANNQLNAALQAFTSSENVFGIGDLNADGKVSIGDLAIVAGHYRGTSVDSDWNTYKLGDMNNDGTIDIVDIAAIARLILG